MLNKGLFSSDKDDWETPQKLFEKLNDRYHFVIDLAATSKNAKCKNYYTVEDDALSKDWSKVNGPKWLNPPYGRQLGLWVKKAYTSSIKCKDPIVLLIPARTDTSYWHEYIFYKAHIDFLRGRLKFEHNGSAGDSAPFPSAIVTYNFDMPWL